MSLCVCAGVPSSLAVFGGQHQLNAFCARRRARADQSLKTLDRLSAPPSRSKKKNAGGGTMPPPAGGSGPSDDLGCDDLGCGAPSAGAPAAGGACLDEEARSGFAASPLRGAGVLRDLRDGLAAVSAVVGAAAGAAASMGAAVAEDRGGGLPPVPAPARSTALTRPMAALAWRSQPPRFLGVVACVGDAGSGDGARPASGWLAGTGAASCCGAGAARRAGDVRTTIGGVCGSVVAAATPLACCGSGCERTFTRPG